jgi:probable F420-dependent oxidoreductase
LKIDAEIMTDSLTEIPTLAKKAEEFGFDCVWVNETKHDPFVQLTLASSSTSSISLGSAIALAFTRSPTATAYAAWDLQKLSRGRLVLGLGSQVKGHIERRFGMKWESPEPKMREVVLALRSVWKSWQEGKPLDFHGRFFTLDLMTPFFNPGPIGQPEIPVYIAGVNKGMYGLVGEVGDGLHVHPLHTVRYLREVMTPALTKGLARAHRRRENIVVAASVFAAVGENESQIRNVENFLRDQIAFYASTRTYRKVLELHGWGDLSDRLHDYSVKGSWSAMGGEISEDVLGEFVVRGTWDEIGSEIRRKYEGVVDRVRLYLPFDGSADWRSFVRGFSE